MMKFAKKCLILFFAVTLALASQVIMLSITTATALATDISPVCTAKWGGTYDDQAWDVIKIGDYFYVTGNKRTSSSTFDLFIRKYELDCDLVWEEIWDNGDEDAGFVLATDGSYLYVGGYTLVDGIGKALLQKRYLTSDPATDGTIVWTKTWGDVSNRHYEVDGIATAMDASEEVIYVSYWKPENSTNPYYIDAAVKKVDSDGNDLWNQDTIWGTANKTDTADGNIYADTSGVWVAGRINGTVLLGVPTGGDAYLTKIASNGTQSWRNDWGGSYYDQAFSLSSDGSNVYLSGSTKTGGTNYDALLLKHGMEDGSFTSTTKNSSSTTTDWSRGISAADSNYIYVNVYRRRSGLYYIAYI